MEILDLNTISEIKNPPDKTNKIMKITKKSVELMIALGPLFNVKKREQNQF